MGQPSSLPTIYVYGVKPPLSNHAEAFRINECDFDPALHRRAGDAKATSNTEVDALPEHFPGLLMLGRAGIKTLDDIEGKTFDDLKAIPGIGAATAKAIIAAANKLIGEE